MFDVTQEDIKGFDVVVNAFGAPAGQEELHVKAGRHSISIFQGIATKLVVVGERAVYLWTQRKSACDGYTRFPSNILSDSAKSRT